MWGESVNLCITYLNFPTNCSCFSCFDLTFWLIPVPGLSSHGSMKKRAAPPPPTQNNNTPATPCHSRTPSDPGLSQSPSGAIHRRNHSTDLISCSSHSINHSGSSASDFSINGNNLRFQTASVTLGRIVIPFWVLLFWMAFRQQPTHKIPLKKGLCSTLCWKLSS